MRSEIGRVTGTTGSYSLPQREIKRTRDSWQESKRLMWRKQTLAINVMTMHYTAEQIFLIFWLFCVTRVRIKVKRTIWNAVLIVELACKWWAYNVTSSCRKSTAVDSGYRIRSTSSNVRWHLLHVYMPLFIALMLVIIIIIRPITIIIVIVIMSSCSSSFVGNVDTAGTVLC